MRWLTELPPWAIWLAVFLIPLIAVAAGLFGNHIARRNAIEADKRGQREEEMRQMRWAADHLTSGDPKRELLGAGQLDALLNSDLLTEAEKVFIEAALATHLSSTTAEIEEAKRSGEAIAVIQITLEEAETIRALKAVEEHCWRQGRLCRPQGRVRLLELPTNACSNACSGECNGPRSNVGAHPVYTLTWKPGWGQPHSNREHDVLDPVLIALPVRLPAPAYVSFVATVTLPEPRVLRTGRHTNGTGSTATLEGAQGSPASRS